MIRFGFAPGRKQPVGAGLVYSYALPRCQSAHWAWIADTHIRGDIATTHPGSAPAQRLERIVREIDEVRPDAVLVNGDLAWSEGTQADYSRFGRIIQSLPEGTPVVLGVGNHDHRGNLLSVLGGVQDVHVEWLAAVVEQPPFRFVQLDSQIAPGEVGGEIGVEQLEWLEGILDSGTTLATILFVHHPGESSSMGCRDFDALVDITERFPAVRAIVTGHDHAYGVRRIGSVDHIMLPAAGFSFEAEADCGWIEATLGPHTQEIGFHGSRSYQYHLFAWRLQLS